MFHAWFSLAGVLVPGSGGLPGLLKEGGCFRAAPAVAGWAAVLYCARPAIVAASGLLVIRWARMLRLERMKGAGGGAAVALAFVLLCCGGRARATYVGEDTYWYTTTPEGKAPIAYIGNNSSICDYLQVSNDGRGQVGGNYMWADCNGYIGTYSYTFYFYTNPLRDDRDPLHVFNSAPWATGYTARLNPGCGAGYCGGNQVYFNIATVNGLPAGTTQAVLLPNTNGVDGDHVRYIYGFDRANVGKYDLHISSGGAIAGINYDYDLGPMYYTFGQWSTKPPPGIGAPPLPAGGTVSGSNGALNVYVFGNGIVLSGQAVTLKPSNQCTNCTGSQTVNTGSNGIAAFTNIIPGYYEVDVAAGALGNITWQQQARMVNISGGQLVNLSMNVGGDGSISWQGGDSTSNQGSSGLLGGLQDILTNALKSLFVPDQAHIDQCKQDMSSFFNWGPFSLLVELEGLLSTPAGGQTLIAIPTPRVTNNALDFSAGTYAPVNLPTVTGIGAWTWLRAAMGAAVYAAFAVAVVRFLMPRFNL